MLASVRGYRARFQDWLAGVTCALIPAFAGVYVVTTAKGPLRGLAGICLLAVAVLIAEFFIRDLYRRRRQEQRGGPRVPLR